MDKIYFPSKNELAIKFNSEMKSDIWKGNIKALISRVVWLDFAFNCEFS